MKYQWRSGFRNFCANYRAKDEVTKASLKWHAFQRAINAGSKRTIRNQTERGESIRERERKRQLHPAMRHSSWSDGKLSQRPREQPKNPPIFQQSLRKIENSKVYDTVENVRYFLELKYLEVLRKCIYCRKFLPNVPTTCALYETFWNFASGIIKYSYREYTGKICFYLVKLI